MPVKRGDAERLLNLLWELKIEALKQRDEKSEEIILPEEDHAFSNAISMLHCYLTDIVPTITQSHHLALPDTDTHIDISISPNANVQWVEFSCRTSRDPGLHLESFHEAVGGTYIVFISQVEKGTVAEQVGVFKRGDIILKINKHSLARVSIERARWLMKSAARSGKIVLSIITCDGRHISYPWRKSRGNLKQEVPVLLHSVPTTAEVHSSDNKKENDQPSHSIINRRPSFTPSIGSHDSDHETLMNTVEVAAHISRSSFRYSNKRLKGKNRKPLKVSIPKEGGNGSLGMRLIGGKGSKYGDIGIFICAIEEGKPAHSDGRLKKGDEILMINGKSVVGRKLIHIVQTLRDAQSPVNFIVATERLDDLQSKPSSVSLESSIEAEVHQLLSNREKLVAAPMNEIFGQNDSPSQVSKRITKSAHDLQSKPHQRKKPRVRKISDQTAYSSEVIELKDLSPPVATLSTQPLTQWGRLSSSNIETNLEPAKKNIVLMKFEGKALGFSLCGGKGSKRGDLGIYVRSIQEKGLAAEDGRLKEGDELIEINGRSLEGFTHKKAASIIKNLSGVINLTIISGPGYLVIPGKVKHSSSVKGTPIHVILHRRDDEELGLEIAGLTNDKDEYGIFIKHIIPHSPADACKMLHRADQLVSINNRSLLDLPVEEAMDLLSPTNLPFGSIPLQVVRPKSDEALNKLLSDENKRGSYPNNWQGSFRMKDTHQKDTEFNEEEIPSQDYPLTPLDKDILDLFTPSETGSINGIGEGVVPPSGPPTSLPPTDHEGHDFEFPSIVSALKYGEEANESLLSSMTPILTRPSIASQYSRPYSQTDSPALTKDFEMKVFGDHKRGSGHAMYRYSNEIKTAMESKEEEQKKYGVTSNKPEQETTFQDVIPPVPPPAIPPPPPPNEDVHFPLLSSPPHDDNQDVDLSIQSTIPLGFQQLELDICKHHGKRGVGITLVNSTGLTKGYSLVRRILPGSVGGKYGLHVGDRIVSINNQCVQGLTPHRIMGILSEAPKQFMLTIWRDPNYDMDTTSSVYSQSIYSESVLSVSDDGGGTDSSGRHPSISSQLPSVQSLTEQVESEKFTANERVITSQEQTSFSPARGSPVIIPPSFPPPPVPKSPPPSPPPDHPLQPESPLPPEPESPPPSPPPNYPPEPESPPPSPPPNYPEPESPPPSPPHYPPEPESPPPSPPNYPPEPDSPPPSPPHYPPEPESPPPSPPLDRPPDQQFPPSFNLPSTSVPVHTTSTLPQEKDEHFESKGSRDNHNPFQVEVTKGLLSLGLGVIVNKMGMVEVKSISSRSPLTKDGNLNVGDHLLSINNNDLIGCTLKEAENIIKSIPRGNVKIEAMPKDVTGTGLKNEEKKIEESSTTGRDEEEGVLKVKLNRSPDKPLGIIVEGGSDTALKNIYIASLKPRSAAFINGQLQRGDQIIMCGNECLVGVTSLEAWDILNKAPLIVEIVAARKKESITQLRSSISETPLSTQPIEQKPQFTHNRRHSFSLHFSGSSYQRSSVYSSFEDVREDFDIMDTSPPPPPPLPLPEVNEEHFTVVLHREENQRLGFGINGGIENLQLPDIYVKSVEPNSLAGMDGQLRRGDKIVSVNGNTLVGVTHKAALHLLKNAGNTVTLEVTRLITGISSRAASKQISRQESNNTSPSCHSSGSPSPLLSRVGRGKRHSIVGRLGLAQTQGVKVVEIHKGPTGLGMHLKGSLLKERAVPITIKEVLSGGAAYKSGMINIGDTLLEANGIEFEDLTQKEAVDIIKGLPQGTVRLVLLDKHYSSTLNLDVM